MSATALAPLAAAPARRPSRRAVLRRRARPRPLRATYGPIGESIEEDRWEELAPEVLVVNDDSEAREPQGAARRPRRRAFDESHFSVTVVSEQFAGMTPIKRHRLVNSILQKEFDDGLHALQLSTKTPAEWEKTNK